MTTLKHQDFIDLMKAFGMLLIVIGHVIGDPQNIYNLISQPAFTKQIGVAFFVFVTGWGLANNRKPPVRAVFNRIFPFYFWGIIFSVFLSILFFILKNDINPSNYLPFFLGINVFLNYFPANPTTWYIGTYLHILLFWYIFLQGKEIGFRHIIAAFIVENIVRCFFLYLEQSFVAYMLLPNWLTIFVLGMFCHRKRQKDPSIPAAVILLILWIFFLAIWTSLCNTLEFSGNFPFRSMSSNLTIALPLESLMISFVYIVNTYWFFEISRRLPGHNLISYLSKATLITVIIHMPIVFNTHRLFYSYFDNRLLAQIIFIIIIYFGSAFIANTLQKLIDINTLKEKTWKVLSEIYFNFSRKT